MLSVYYGRNEYPVKCQLYQPVYEGEGVSKTIISWIPSDKFCYCKEKDFQTSQTQEQNRRYKSTKGTLITNTLKKDEISLDWKILYEDELFIITEIIQKDDEKQQVMLRKPLVITTLQVRR